ncbi:MAG: alpha-amylase [Actinobacteria bacterium]|nr:alpha-amylase [Actinomycetota bacterium]
MHPDTPWWKTAVAYQIYPRSFADSNADGVGDLEGIRRHLDYLAWLGVDALWISPFYRSPMADFGYDVSDYCDVDPLFGTLDDFDRLVADAHGRGMKVIVDWVPNHTSDQHAWFRESRATRDNAKRDWYIWRDAKPGGSPPNNWISSFTFEPAWTLDDRTGQMYLHCFLEEQPDLNWQNPEVVAAMHDTLRFWLDRGVDGFRMDVIHLIGKDPTLADDPADLAALSHVPLNNRPETHELLRGLRTLLDSYNADRVAVGEVYLLDTKLVAEHYGHGDELHLNFNFPPLYTAWDAAKWRKQIERAARELDPIDAWPTWVLSNHDNARHRTRYGGSEARARAAALLLLTLRGTPFLYAGEELGLEDADVPPGRTVDPGGRDGCRAPIPWTADAPHGWEGAEPWLPWSPCSGERSVESLLADESSILHLYRRLISARKESPALLTGGIELLDAPRGVLAFSRRDVATADLRTVLVNFADETIDLEGFGSCEVVVSTAPGGEGARFTGTVSGASGVLLRG